MYPFFLNFPKYEVLLIQHKNKDLLPEYLSFIVGVVDSEDLPLNISRETLQENIIFNNISSSVTSQVLSYMQKIAKDDPEQYVKFWKEHGQIFKLGYMDFTNADKYKSLLRFNSSVSKDADELVSLDEYVERIKKDQKEIYYAFGPSRDALTIDPHLELFKSKGIEGELYLRRGRVIPALKGASVSLTLDQNIQYMAENALDKIMEEHKPKGAWAIVQKVRTGEILAMVVRRCPARR